MQKITIHNNSKLYQLDTSNEDNLYNWYKLTNKHTREKAINIALVQNILKPISTTLLT